MTDTTPTLPPLPEPWIRNLSEKQPESRDHFAADQMHAYAIEHASALQAENDKLRADIARLRQALLPFAAFERVRSTMGGLSPKEGDLWACSTRAGDAEITVEDMREAIAASASITERPASTDKLRADAERFQWWFTSAPKPEWFTVEYLQGVREGLSLDQWRALIDAARASIPGSQT